MTIKITTSDLAKNIRRHALNMTSTGNSSHIGSILSIADILAVLYGQVLKVKPDNPLWGKRDRFIFFNIRVGLRPTRLTMINFTLRGFSWITGAIGPDTAAMIHIDGDVVTETM